MPNRIVREAILSSERIAMLGWPEEVFYRRVMSLVDDYGRFEANPQLLRARCYPLQTDAVRATDISRWMAACQKAGLILCYEVSGKAYLELLNFGQQQRTTSKYPAPQSSEIICQQEIAAAHLGVSVFGVVSEGVVVEREQVAPTTRAKMNTKLPEDFSPDATGVQKAREAGFDPDAEMVKFRDHHVAKGSRMANWQAAYRTWIDKAKQFRRATPATFAEQKADIARTTVPANPSDLFVPAPDLTPEQLEANRRNAAKQLEALKARGIAGLKVSA